MATILFICVILFYALSLAWIRVCNPIGSRDGLDDGQDFEGPFHAYSCDNCNKEGNQYDMHEITNRRFTGYYCDNCTRLLSNRDHGRFHN